MKIEPIPSDNPELDKWIEYTDKIKDKLFNHRNEINPTNMLLIEKKVIDEIIGVITTAMPINEKGEIKDKVLHSDLVTNVMNKFHSKEVEVVDIDEAKKQWLESDLSNEWTFNYYIQKMGYQLIKIKE